MRFASQRAGAINSICSEWRVAAIAGGSMCIFSFKLPGLLLQQNSTSKLNTSDNPTIRQVIWRLFHERIR